MNTSSTSSTSLSSSSSSKKNKKQPTSATNNTRLKLSTDPQSVAARERRHRISDRFKILQSLVPGGTKMDTVSMLEEAIHYVKFLKAQIWLHQNFMMLNPNNPNPNSIHPPPLDFPSSSSSTAPVLPPHHLHLQDLDYRDSIDDNNTNYDYVYGGDCSDGQQETVCLDEWFFKY